MNETATRVRIILVIVVTAVFTGTAELYQELAVARAWGAKEMDNKLPMFEQQPGGSQAGYKWGYYLDSAT